MQPRLLPGKHTVFLGRHANTAPGQGALKNAIVPLTDASLLATLHSSLVLVAPKGSEGGVSLRREGKEAVLWVQGTSTSAWI